MVDINILRSIFTVIIFIAFVAICVWAWSKKRKSDFDEAANLPFEDGKPRQTPKGVSK